MKLGWPRFSASCALGSSSIPDPVRRKSQKDQGCIELSNIEVSKPQAEHRLTLGRA